MQALANKLPGSSLDNFKVCIHASRANRQLIHGISKAAGKGLFSDLEVIVDPQSSEKKISAAIVCLCWSDLTLQNSVEKNHLRSKKGTKKQFYLENLIQKATFGSLGSKHVRFFFKQIKALEEEDEEEDEGIQSRVNS